MGERKTDKLCRFTRICVDIAIGWHKLGPFKLQKWLLGLWLIAVSLKWAICASRNAYMLVTEQKWMRKELLPAMMTTITEDPLPVLLIEDFLPCKACHDSHTALHLAGHLKQILGKYGKGEKVTLRLPSVIDLANFYQCSVIDVFEALYALNMQYYSYQIHSLDTGIILQDPLNRKKSHEQVREIA